jgi:hypothetical protein
MIFGNGQLLRSHQKVARGLHAAQEILILKTIF